MPRFDHETNELLGKQPARHKGAYNITRSHNGTTTYGASYSHGAMTADSYADVTHVLKSMHRRCENTREIGFRRKLPDMINASNSELSLLELLLRTCDQWYAKETAYTKRGGDDE